MKNMWGIPSKDREQKRKDIRGKLNKDAKTKKNVVDSSLPSSLRLATTSINRVHQSISTSLENYLNITYSSFW